LEAEHYGEFVAISPEGKLVLGKDDLEVLKKALKEFGKGNFAFRRIGFKALGKWISFRIKTLTEFMKWLNSSPAS